MRKAKMFKNIKIGLTSGLIIFLGVKLSGIERRNAAGEERSICSPVAVIADAAGTGVYVAESLARRVVHVTLADGRAELIAKTEAPPSGLALDAKAGRLFVTLDIPDGKVIALDAGTGRKQFSIDVGHSALGPALTADGAGLAVCNRFNNSVSLVDLETRKELCRVPVPREPVAAEFSEDGKWLVVANHLPNMRANAEYVMPAVSLINPATRSVVTNVMLPNGSTSLRGLCLSPDSRFAYVTHTLAHYQLPTTQLERGWMNASAISIIDLSGSNRTATVLLDDVDMGAANPW